VLARDPHFRVRFDNEARAISALDHPHICALYDVGEQDGRDYFVMELVEGETLARRLARGPLPPDQILRHAIDIAEALDHAHRHGIVHRDLKPANVILTKAGTKLLGSTLVWRRCTRRSKVVPSTRSQRRRTNSR
ncbi:MAG: protein kinase domain-containing protein, partial [Vicinamibacterales bacterium]